MQNSCAFQATWMKKIIKELNFKRQGHTIISNCDNKSVIKLFKNLILHGR